MFSRPCVVLLCWGNEEIYLNKNSQKQQNIPITTGCQRRSASEHFILFMRFIFSGYEKITTRLAFADSVSVFGVLFSEKGINELGFSLFIYPNFVVFSPVNNEKGGMVHHPCFQPTTDMKASN